KDESEAVDDGHCRSRCGPAGRPGSIAARGRALLRSEHQPGCPASRIQPPLTIRRRKICARRSLPVGSLVVPIRQGDARRAGSFSSLVRQSPAILIGGWNPGAALRDRCRILRALTDTLTFFLHYVHIMFLSVRRPSLRSSPLLLNIVNRISD